MKWSINEKLNRNHGLELKLWKIYVENENGEKVETRLLPKNTTEYLFTNLGLSIKKKLNYNFFLPLITKKKRISKINFIDFCFPFLEAHTSYTMGLCMLTVNEATKCLSKRIESANSFLSK